jgi:hypothetical protein
MEMAMALRLFDALELGFDVMSDRQPMQKTSRGHPIPVPRREDVFGDLRKVAPPVPPPRPKRKRSS